jgi:hypothetical protein
MAIAKVDTFDRTPRRLFNKYPSHKEDDYCSFPRFHDALGFYVIQYFYCSHSKNSSAISPWNDPSFTGRRVISTPFKAGEQVFHLCCSYALIYSLRLSGWSLRRQSASSGLRSELKNLPAVTTRTAWFFRLQNSRSFRTQTLICVISRRVVMPPRNPRRYEHSDGLHVRKKHSIAYSMDEVQGLLLRTSPKIKDSRQSQSYLRRTTPFRPHFLSNSVGGRERSNLPDSLRVRLIGVNGGSE